METLFELLGRERGIDDVARRLYEFASGLGVPVVGALHLTCADESELECADAFRHSFSEHLLPNLKYGERSSFRLANLGAKYEWGATAIAEDHYATQPSRQAFKLMLVKINSHVCVDRDKDGLVFGRMNRYDTDSSYCGALANLLGGGHLPFAGELREAFRSEGVDRVALLLDETRVEPAHRSLFAAVVNARLQARRAMVDIQDRAPASPTLFIVVASVTLNRKQKDTEIVCGLYRADWRGDEPRFEYCGVGDDPTAYRLITEQGPLRIEEPSIGKLRPARNHRELILELWRQAQGADAKPGAPGLAALHAEDLLPSEEGSDDAGDDPREALSRRLTALARHEPVPAAVQLFGHGLADIHHLYRAHRLVRGMAGEQAAQRILRDLHTAVRGYTPEAARAALELFRP